MNARFWQAVAEHYPLLGHARAALGRQVRAGDTLLEQIMPDAIESAPFQATAAALSADLEAALSTLVDKMTHLKASARPGMTGDELVAAARSLEQEKIDALIMPVMDAIFFGVYLGQTGILRFLMPERRPPDHNR